MTRRRLLANGAVSPQVTVVRTGDGWCVDIHRGEWAVDDTITLAEFRTRTGARHYAKQLSVHLRPPGGELL